MEEIICPQCKSDRIVKNGSVKGKRRWKCKECAYLFTKLSIQKGKKSETAKTMANVLYLSGLSFRAIAPLVNASHVSVQQWVKNFAYANYEKPSAEGVVFLELDEMWHFINSKKTSYGYGKLMMLTVADFLTGSVETGILKPLNDFLAG